MNKKTFFSFFLFAVSALMSISLTSCSEDVTPPPTPPRPNPIGETVFASSSDDTRTSMDTDRHFYWEAGDYIWVDTLKDGTFTGKSQGIELSNPTKAPSAKFYFRQIILTEQKYDLTYTGNNSNKGTEVTIAATQTQTEWNNAAHLGESGDCGVAEATRDNSTGIYSFSLKHKAAYIVFAPYKNASITDGWKLTKIEIIADGTTIAGTYPFSATGLNTSGVTNSSETVTLNCTDGFTLPTSSSDCCFAVIQPGTHKLSIKYTIKPTGSVNGVAGETFTFTKEIASRSYKVNGVTTIRHEFTTMSYSPLLHYCWDAVNPCWYGVANENIPKAHGAVGTGYPDPSDTNRWSSAVYAPTPASRSCKDLPNANAMSWYVMAGDPRLEFDYPWVFDGSDGRDVCTQGAWILKSENITGFRTDVSYDNVTDLRTTAKVATSNIAMQYRNNSTSAYNGGRPAATELSKYFFLPAMGHVSETGKLSVPYGAYWTSTATPSPPYDNGYGAAYMFAFQNHSEYGAFYVVPATRGRARVVAPDWFQ